MTLKFTGNQTEVVYSATLNNMAYANQNSLLSGCLVKASTPAAMTVDVESGRIFFGNDEIDVSASTDTLTIDTESSTNNRIDLIVVNESGVLSIIKGTASAIPATPNYDPELYIVLAIITVNNTITTITTDEIRDLRLLNLGGSGGSGGTFGRHVEEFSAQTSVTVTHNLGDDEPNVFVYDSSNELIIPESVTVTDINSLVVTFSTSSTGKIVVYGGVGVNNGYYAEDYSSSATWVVTHNLNQQYVNVVCYDSSDVVIEESAITSITMDSDSQCTVVLGSATAGRVVVTGGTSTENYIQNLPVTSQTTNYTLIQSDNNSIIKLNPSSYVTLTLPDGLTEGFQCAIVNMSSENIAITASTTLRSSSAKYNLANQYGVMTAVHLGSNEWVIFGELS